MSGAQTLRYHALVEEIVEGQEFEGGTKFTPVGRLHHELEKEGGGKTVRKPEQKKVCAL